MGSKERKYILVDRGEVCGVTKLYRVQAVRDFGNVNAGELGGLVEGSHNLSRVGGAWVGGDAVIRGRARVKGNALVEGNALMEDSAIVDGAAYVGGRACVCGRAYVLGMSRVEGCAYVSGEAVLNDRAKADGNVRIIGCVGVFDDSHVSGTALVVGDVRLFGEALVESKSDYFYIPNIGSRGGTTYFCRQKCGTILVKCGCFRGSVVEFEEAVKRKHGNNKHGLVYQQAINLALLHMDSRLREVKV